LREHREHHSYRFTKDRPGNLNQRARSIADYESSNVRIAHNEWFHFLAELDIGILVSDQLYSSVSLAVSFS